MRNQNLTEFPKLYQMVKKNTSCRLENLTTRVKLRMPLRKSMETAMPLRRIDPSPASASFWFNAIRPGTDKTLLTGLVHNPWPILAPRWWPSAIPRYDYIGVGPARSSCLPRRSYRFNVRPVQFRAALWIEVHVPPCNPRRWRPRGWSSTLYTIGEWCSSL